MTMPSAGWYPDPDNESRNRWWNGIAWTDNRTPARAPATAPAPAPAAQLATAATQAVPAAAGGYTAYAAPVIPVRQYGYSTAYQSGYSTASQPNYPANPPATYQKLTAPEGTQWNTPWIWLLVVLPQLSAITAYLFLLVPDAFGDTGLQYYESESFASFIPLIIGVIAYAIGVGCAYLDFRELRNRGVPRPFHWAWGFANNWAVYTIGRSIVVKSRTGKGLAPLWVTAGIFVAGVLVSIVTMIYVITAEFGVF